MDSVLIFFLTLLMVFLRLGLPLLVLLLLGTWVERKFESQR